MLHTTCTDDPKRCIVTFVLLLLSRVIKYALIFMDFSYVTRSCPYVCGNVTMEILCEDLHVLVLLIFDSSLLRGFWSVPISKLRKIPKVIMNIVFMM